MQHTEPHGSAMPVAGVLDVLVTHPEEPRSQLLETKGKYYPVPASSGNGIGAGRQLGQCGEREITDEWSESFILGIVELWDGLFSRDSIRAPHL